MDRTAAERHGDLQRATQALDRFAEAMQEIGETLPEVAVLQGKVKAMSDEASSKVVAEEKVAKEKAFGLPNIKAAMTALPGSISQGSKP